LAIVALIANPVSNDISIVNYQGRLGHNSVSNFGKLVISNRQFMINNATEELGAHFVHSSLATNFARQCYMGFPGTMDMDEMIRY
tara:strand:- start:475 stop:729 length:255 start_codon:yes stop_codon:yes gene_type:complete